MSERVKLKGLSRELIALRVANELEDGDSEGVPRHLRQAAVDEDNETRSDLTS